MLSHDEFERLAEEAFRFHTMRAPGLLIGLAMVDLARDLLGPVEKLNAVAETTVCLPDAIQFMVGCTVGNRYLRILPELGRYALSLYDRTSGRGVRVFVDLKKIDEQKTPEIHRFFLRTRAPETAKPGPAREASGKLIMEEFRRCGREIFGHQRIQMAAFGKGPMPPARICRTCGESFLMRDEATLECDVCNGRSAYYRPMGAPNE